MSLRTLPLAAMLVAFPLLAATFGCSSGGDGDSDGQVTDTAAPEDTGAPDIQDTQGEDTAEPDIDETDVPLDTEQPDTAIDTDTGGGGLCKTDDDCAEAELELVACEVPTCDPETSQCVAGPADDGAECDDGDACTATSSCTEGVCTGGDAVKCDDGNPCTMDGCDPAEGCTTSPTTGDPCDDGNACTQTDACDDGVCTGSEPLVCNDGNPCTADVCEPEVGCTAPNDDGAPCDDGNDCTSDDTCQDGACMPGEDVCPDCETTEDCAEFDDENLCNGTLACIDNNCIVDPATVVVCDTTGDTGCMTTTCDSATGECVIAELGEGDPCDDGDACTAGETCQEGECTGGEVICSDGCEPSDAPGCGGCECETCVCEIDSFCCEFAFDEVCVEFCIEDCGQDCGPVDPPDPDAGCFTSDTPGCGGCECEDCVCGLDPFCCESSWDETCVAECDLDCGANCDGGGEGEEGPEGSTGLGCEESDSPGCGGCSCESCVCALDSFCCNVSWDGLCVDQCIFECGGCEPCDPDCMGKECGGDGCNGSCGSCGAGEACYEGLCEEHCGNGICEDGLEEDCLSCEADCGECQPSTGCEEIDQPGCGGCSCQGCVCAGDSFCCDTAWDADCVFSCLVNCGGCDLDPGCTESAEGGCGGCACEECVCDLDPACCDTAWDAICTLQCQDECGTDCGIVPCTSSADCFDGEPCTVDACDAETGVCTYEPEPGCCTVDADCDDGEPCTDDFCIEGECESLVAADPACCPEDGIVYAVDFEGDIPLEIDNSSELGGWQISKEQAFSTPNAMWYGSKLTGNLNFGESQGSLTTEEISLPSSFTLELKFREWVGQSVSTTVAVLGPEGPVTLEKDVEVEPQIWNEVTVDLKAWAGQTVRLRWTFASPGGSSKGVFLDDIAVESDCFFPECGDGACNGDENCFTCEADCENPADCPANDGCMAWEYPTCAGCDCEECVCDTDPSCCDTVWDNACTFACTECGTECGPDMGCEPLPGVGCGGCPCEECVCAIDPFCCDTQWDSICAGECGTDCGGNCF